MLSRIRTRLATWASGHPITVHYMPAVVMMGLAAWLGGAPTDWVVAMTIFIVLPATIRIIRQSFRIAELEREKDRTEQALERMSERMKADMDRWERLRADRNHFGVN